MKLLYVILLVLGLCACDKKPIYTSNQLDCAGENVNVKIYKDYIVFSSKDMTHRFDLTKQLFKEYDDMPAINMYEQNAAVYTNSSQTGIGIVFNGEECYFDSPEPDDILKNRKYKIQSKTKNIDEKLIKKIFFAHEFKPDNKDLYHAADKGDLNKVKELVEQGYDVNYVCKDSCADWTPVMIAAANGHLDVVRFLLEKGANPNAQNRYGRTAISFAVSYKFKPIVEALLAYGADPSIESQDKDKPNSGLVGALATSISDKDSYEILKMLVYKTGKVNFEFWDYTPLMIAVIYDDYDFAKYLLDNGADINHKKSIQHEDGSITEYTIKGLAESKKMQDLIDSYTVSTKDSRMKEDEKIAPRVSENANYKQLFANQLEDIIKKTGKEKIKAYELPFSDDCSHIVVLGEHGPILYEERCFPIDMRLMDLDSIKDASYKYTIFSQPGVVFSGDYDSMSMFRKLIPEHIEELPKEYEESIYNLNGRKSVTDEDFKSALESLKELYK